MGLGRGDLVLFWNWGKNRHFRELGKFKILIWVLLTGNLD